MKRKICVVTGTRADYGHLYWILREIELDPLLRLQLIVTGAHLSSQWGNTVKVIEEDGFKIDERIEIQLASDTPLATSKALGLCTVGCAEAFSRLKPDLVLLLGDRYEELAAAQAALIMRCPVAHIHGGETSEGAMDESIRHAVTKMAHLHFVATEDYARRVRQLGEDPRCVFNFGAPGLDHLDRSLLAERHEIEEFLGISLDGNIGIVTYHPVTQSTLNPKDCIMNLLAALANFPNMIFVFTGVNADPGYAEISGSIKSFASRHPGRVAYTHSMGQARYLGLMKLANVVIGNSSSGLIEAPAIPIPTVNIGDRQKGRAKASSIIDCKDDIDAITVAIKRAMSKSFCETIGNDNSLYGRSGASKRIVEVLRTHNLDGVLMKPFYDQRNIIN
jgi:UDP-hydrolysing UDP-N-acetyl-D-glucosamine 2-epimerase